MNWEYLTAKVDIYCERMDASYWSEPLNAITNGAFLIAALICWRMLQGKTDFGAKLLTANLALIGIGSYLFHTHATEWAQLTDVIPIQAFILIYVYLATTRLLELPWWAGAASVVGFFPYAAGLAILINGLFGSLNGSVGYIPVAILIAIYGLILLGKDKHTGLGLLIGAGILSLSLVFRTIDETVCPSLPIGTHFLWHTLNGIMLGWMIFVLHRAPTALARNTTAR